MIPNNALLKALVSETREDESSEEEDRRYPALVRGGWRRFKVRVLSTTLLLVVIGNHTDTAKWQEPPISVLVFGT